MTDHVTPETATVQPETAADNNPQPEAAQQGTAPEEKQMPVLETVVGLMEGLNKGKMDGKKLSVEEMQNEIEAFLAAYRDAKFDESFAELSGHYILFSLYGPRHSDVLDLLQYKEYQIGSEKRIGLGVINSSSRKTIEKFGRQNHLTTDALRKKFNRNKRKRTTNHSLYDLVSKFGTAVGDELQGIKKDLHIMYAMAQYRCEATMPSSTSRTRLLDTAERMFHSMLMGSAQQKMSHDPSKDEVNEWHDYTFNVSREVAAMNLEIDISKFEWLQEEETLGERAKRLTDPRETYYLEPEEREKDWQKVVGWHDDVARENWVQRQGDGDEAPIDWWATFKMFGKKIVSIPGRITIWVGRQVHRAFTSLFAREGDGTNKKEENNVQNAQPVVQAPAAA